jgi:hypothetical protein
MRIILPQLSLAALLLISPVARPKLMAQSRAKIDVSKLGPQVGERIPDFSLKDQNGHTQMLQSIMGPKGAMLVFYRSADW